MYVSDSFPVNCVDRKFSNDAADALHDVFFNLMFPDSNRLPAQSFERPEVPYVSRAILRDLLPPE